MVMIRLAAKLLAIFIALQAVSLVNSQPIPRTQWEKINVERVSPDPPRIATFSDGSYIVVYIIAAPNSNLAVGSIFSANGEILVEEFLLPDFPSFNASPRVLIFSDDMFLTAWRETQYNEFHAKMWYRNATAATEQFRISLSAVPPSPSIDAIEIAVMPDDGWCFAYEGGQDVAVQLFDTKQSTTSYYHSLPTLSDSHLNLAFSFPENQIYLFMESTAGTMSAYRISGTYLGGIISTNPSYVGATPSRPFATVMSSGIIPVFWQSYLDDGYIPSSIGLTVVLPGLDIFPNFTVVNDNLESDGAANPTAIDLGNDRLLVAYEGTLGNETRPIYRTVLVSANDQGVRASPLGPEIFDEAVIISLHMAVTIRSEVVVVAINTTDRSIVRRVLTFCGNGAVELREQCDGTEFCAETCECEAGFVSQKGRCVPDCGDGLVVGSEQCDSSSDDSCDNANCVCAAGYIPIVPRQSSCTLQPASFRPSVGPTLDCIAQGEVPVAHFSFLNEDGFLQTIPFGDLNQFSPNTLGANRPTQFASGASLTYPAGPFRLELPSDIQSFTWLLGQFNLTVDLTNITALRCPRDISFLVRFLTSDVLTDDLVQIFLNNFARRYGISESRLTATIVWNNPGPAERRRAAQQDTLFYDYTVTVTVADSTDEPSAEEVLNEFFTEYKNTTKQEEIIDDLTQGLESVNPQVKEITPAPTGVSVRSERFDAPPVAENNPPQAVTQPVKVSSASSNLMQILLFLFGLVLSRY
jgi:hypothetical protein